ncbi:MAG: hypothetical protein H0X39_15175 [Actinobacteria bacterium]|nr:hypothetical protein [Actinomycetota bacterium]
MNGFFDQPRVRAAATREIHIELIAARIAELTPDLRTDLLHAIVAHNELWTRRRAITPTPLEIQRRVCRLDEFAEALAGQPTPPADERDQKSR